MNDFEQELRSALRRKEPPAGFASRVRARTRQERSQRGREWIAGAIAACLLLAAGGGFGYQQYQGRKASRELVAALEIAGSKLSSVQKKVSELNRRSIHE